MARILYFDGPGWGGMNAWRMKALYRVGQAGRRGRACALPPGTVRKYLLSCRFIMKVEPGRYILTAFGQAVFKEIKTKKAPPKPSRAP